MPQFRPNFDDDRDARDWERNHAAAVCSQDELTADEVAELKELIKTLEGNQ